MRKKELQSFLLFTRINTSPSPSFAHIMNSPRTPMSISSSSAGSSLSGASSSAGVCWLALAVCWWALPSAGSPLPSADKPLPSAGSPLPLMLCPRPRRLLPCPHRSLLCPRHLLLGLRRLLCPRPWLHLSPQFHLLGFVASFNYHWNNKTWYLSLAFNYWIELYLPRSGGGC